MSIDQAFDGRVVQSPAPARFAEYLPTNVAASDQLVSAPLSNGSFDAFVVTCGLLDLDVVVLAQCVADIAKRFNVAVFDHRPLWGHARPEISADHLKVQRLNVQAEFAFEFPTRLL